MAADACPVDHKSREAWLEQARAAEASKAAAAASSSSSAKQCPVDHTAQAPSSWGARLSSLLWSSPSPPAAPVAQPSRSAPGLDIDRVVSTIPRVASSDASSSSSSSPCPVEHGASANPANSELESGADAASGNWVYPSEKMFFDAMRRKGYDARVADMKTVVPIHNAVNERAWKEIKEWEAPYLAQSQCGGPRLESFANKNDRMTPTARLNTILGFTAPFDRHDWVIDRCGTRVEYVIDFYAGRPGGAGAAPGPSFYLDVRPKLNTWEGVKMRAMRWAHLA
ncbi:cytochrome C1 heme lyase [Cordyceps fumosorosea ARSEF 2679]|uniref:Holocytochrome c-type synthase n=1 Tax=Cordyceps fumosorosea (strain ARSEF 2679) TaxID=1081104 RepID=A0A167VZI3_CORFA|nr:cytochrome C1 heme lyase [Cordyceps fumosorosea ARSEF 2679]OAA63150.1 cytochrome C1 heme lyase [Cordyceps fumosorosea ARSEF 2679]